MGRQDEGHAGAMLAGITLGALIGAGVALLLAPQKGEETRTQLSRRARTLRDDASQYLDEASTTARQKLARGKRRVREAAEDTADAVRERFAEQTDG